MDNTQQKHDKWFTQYKDRSEANFEDYQKIINANNSLLEKINSGDAYVKNRLYDKAIKVLSLGIDEGEKLLSSKNLIDEVELAKAYMNRGVAYEYLGNGEKTICDKRKCVEMLEKFHSNDNLEDKYVLALAYMNRGATYDAMGNYGMAIADGETSKKKLDQLEREGKDVSSDREMVLANISSAKTKRNQSASSYKETDLTMEEMNRAIKMAENEGDKATLASMYTMRGLGYFQLSEYIKAVSDFDDAINIMEGIQQLDENELAKAYAGRGMARYGKRELELSIPDLKKSIEIWECLKEKGKFVDENMLSMAYSIIGMILNETNVINDNDNANEALSNYNKSIKIVENCKKDIIDNNLALAYMCKGVSFDQKEEYLEANFHYDKAIEILEQLDKKGIDIDYSEFAKAYMNRGANYYQTHDVKQALENYEKCISIIERLQNIGVAQDAFDMVMAYKNRGRAYEVDGNFKKAIDDNITALRIIKKVFSTQPELQEEYYGTLIEIMEMIVNNNDQERFNNIIEEFLYSMRYVPKTAEAEEIQNSILEQLE